MPFTQAASYITNFHKKIIRSYTTSTQSTLIKNFFIFSCGSVMLRGVSLLTAPFTLSVLSPADYGLLSLITSFNTVMIAVLGLGLRQVFFLEYFHCSSQDKPSMTNTIIGIYILIAVPCTLLCLMMHKTLNTALFCNTASCSMIALSVSYCFLFFFVDFFYQHLQCESKAVELTKIQIALALMTILLHLLFVYYLRYGVYGIIISTLFSAITACLIAAYYYWHAGYHSSFNLTQSISHARKYLYYGLPFIPSVLCSWIIASGDKWILARYATLHEVGIYSIADAFSQLFYLTILYPLSGSYIPWLMKQFADNTLCIADVERKNRIVMYHCMIGVGLAITIGYCVGKPLLYYMLPVRYHESIVYIWLILMGNVFWMGTYFASALIQYHKKSSFLAFALCVPAVGNILLNIALIPSLGIYGCALATLIAYTVYFALIAGYNHRLLMNIAKDPMA